MEVRLPSMSSREVIKDLKAHGWEDVRTRGSHHHFRHPTQAGFVTVPHPKRDLHPKTLRTLYKAAGLAPPWER